MLYVEELIGPDTVNTLPPATLAAFRDHGLVRPSLFEDVEGAGETLSQLAEEGIPIKEVTDLLLEQGLQLFSDAFDKLLAAVRQRSGMVVSGMVDLDTSTEPENSGLAPRASPADKPPGRSLASNSFLEWNAHVGEFRQVRPRAHRDQLASRHLILGVVDRLDGDELAGP